MRSNPIHHPGRRPASPSTIPPELAAVQAQQEAENALSMALHHLRTPTSNIPGARRKAVQALAALKHLHRLASPDGAHTARAGGAQ